MKVKPTDIFHIHTFRCKHAEEVPDEAYVKKALELGAKGIWFFDHAKGEEASYITCVIILRNGEEKRNGKFIYSDLHFGHANVIRFDHRPFLDVDEMDRFLIQMWNHRVQTDDHVYILGDVCYRNTQPEEWYLRQLKGHKHLIIGNHDWHLLNNEKAMSYFESADQMLYINDNGNGVHMCHYPIAVWNRMMSGTYHVFGHIHAKKNEVSEYMSKKERALNAGCMINGYAPASLNEMIRFQKGQQ